MSKRVLVAADELHVSRLLKVNLERQGHSVKCVADGAKAVAEMSRQPSYDVVVLDLTTPGPDALEVLGWVRRNEQTSKAVVIILSARANTLKNEPLEHQPDLWVQKPVVNDDFSQWF